MNNVNSLMHASWNCKYHIVLISKVRRANIYGKIKTDMGQIARKIVCLIYSCRRSVYQALWDTQKVKEV